MRHTQAIIQILTAASLLIALHTADAQGQARCRAACIDDCPDRQSCIRLSADPERCDCLPDVPTPGGGGPNVKLDHFLCYEAAPSFPLEPEIVDLEDQFGKTENVKIFGALAFCNPVEKTRDRYSEEKPEIAHPDHHLTAYKIDGKEEKRREVYVRNQFSKKKRELTVGKPQWLLVPTQKVRPRRHERPEGLDHFKCYEILHGQRPEATVDLKDQFGKYRKVSVGRPLALCNPVKKTYKREETPAENPAAHLLCYGIDHKLDKPLPVAGTNQLRDERLIVQRIFGLCVPSTKQEKTDCCGSLAPGTGSAFLCDEGDSRRKAHDRAEASCPDNCELQFDCDDGKDCTGESIFCKEPSCLDYDDASCAGGKRYYCQGLCRCQCECTE